MLKNKLELIKMAVVIETTLGDITVDLFLDQRPVTCLNFLKLCKMKYYNFNLFHTIRSGFIAQTGDPTGEGSGGESIFGVLEGPSKRFFSGEKMPKIRHTDIGLLSMVCTDDMMVGSQFFFTLGPDLDSLDGIHCVIGEVTEGHDVLRKLNEVICDETHRPYQDVRITHTVVLEDPFNDPPGLRAPSRSPSPNPERLKGGRIAPDEELDETQGKTAEEIQEMIEEKEAKARATILEIIGDLPDADIAPPENVLFVCKLNPVTTDEDLEIIFSRFGKIESCEVIRDKKTGDSLQYAFIEFADKKSCEDAYFKMDNVLIDDRRIHVDFSQSVSKIKWLGKGRGVKHVNENDHKESQTQKSLSHKSNDREKESRNKRETDSGRGRENRNRREIDRDNTSKSDQNRDGHKEKNKDKKNREEIYSKSKKDNRQRSRSRHRNDDSKNNLSKTYHHEHNDKKQKKDRNRSKSRDNINTSKKEDVNEKHHGSRKEHHRESYSNNNSGYKESRKERSNEIKNNTKDSRKEDSRSNRHHDSRNEYLGANNSNNIDDKYAQSYSNSHKKKSSSQWREKNVSPAKCNSSNHGKEYPKNHDHKGKYNTKTDEITEEQNKIKKNKMRDDSARESMPLKKEDKLEGETPPVKSNKKSKDSKNVKSRSSRGMKNSKKKRKPSTSSSESDSSDSSSSSSESSSSSDSDHKKKKSKMRKRKRSETSSSTSSSSSSSSSSSDSSSETSSSSSDSEPRKKKRKSLSKNNKKYRKK